jgi:hypothetical protein
MYKSHKNSKTQFHGSLKRKETIFLFEIFKSLFKNPFLMEFLISLRMKNFGLIHIHQRFILGLKSYFIQLTIW